MEKYELTVDDVKNGINRILADAYASSTISANPKIMYITSGPGAGKTSIVMHLKQQFKEEKERAYSIDSDSIAEFHPYYDELLQELPEVCYTETRKFVRPATPLIFEELIKNKINIINENVLNKGKNDLDQMRKFRDNGYKVSINIIATDLFESRLSCFEREAAMLQAGLTPRGCSKETQLKMYDAFVPEVEQIEQMGLADEINVFIRGENISKPPILKYSTNGESKYKNFKEAIKAERTAQRNNIMMNPATYLFRIENARRIIQEYGVNPELTDNALKGLDELQQDFISELRRDEIEH